MTTISFKADTEFKQTVEFMAQRKGINTSAFIKLLLTKELENELNQVTANGLTVAEEMRIVHANIHDEVSGPFTTAKSLLRALKK